MKNITLTIVLAFLSTGLMSQNEINKPNSATYYLAYDSINNIYHSGVTLPNQVTTSGQPSFKANVNEIAFLESTDNLTINYTQLPEVGEQVDRGIYEYQTKLVICRQAHVRTTFAPEDTPALFAVYRPEGDNVLDWIVGELVYVGQLRKYNAVTYECIQQNLTITGQTPDVVPALWVVYVEPGTCPDWVQPTGAQDAYDVGDCVTYQGQEWISNTPANVWAPDVFGWELK